MPDRIPVGSPPSEISVGRTCPKPTPPVPKAPATPSVGAAPEAAVLVVVVDGPGRRGGGHAARPGGRRGRRRYARAAARVVLDVVADDEPVPPPEQAAVPNPRASTRPAARLRRHARRIARRSGPGRRAGRHDRRGTGPRLTGPLERRRTRASPSRAQLGLDGLERRPHRRVHCEQSRPPASWVRPAPVVTRARRPRPTGAAPDPPPASARTGRWSDPACGNTSPATGRNAPRTMMWSIWLCGRQVGQVRPTTARRHPGMKRWTSGPQVFMSPASTASGRASVRSWRRSSAQLRCEPKWRCDMWVPATEIGLPSTVRSTTSAARRTRSARRTLMCTSRVASIGSSGRTSTAMPHVPGSASCQRAMARTRAGCGRTPSM